MQNFEFTLGQRFSRLSLKIAQNDGFAELFGPVYQQVFVAQNNGATRKVGESQIKADVGADAGRFAGCNGENRSSHGVSRYGLQYLDNSQAKCLPYFCRLTQIQKGRLKTVFA
jgi:hypothetical protein